MFKKIFLCTVWSVHTAYAGVTMHLIDNPKKLKALFDAPNQMIEQVARLQKHRANLEKEKDDWEYDIKALQKALRTVEQRHDAYIQMDDAPIGCIATHQDDQKNDRVIIDKLDMGEMKHRHVVASSIIQFIQQHYPRAQTVWVPIMRHTEVLVRPLLMYLQCNPSKHIDEIYDETMFQGWKKKLQTSGAFHGPATSAKEFEELLFEDFNAFSEDVAKQTKKASKMSVKKVGNTCIGVLTCSSPAYAPDSTFVASLYPYILDQDTTKLEKKYKTSSKLFLSSTIQDTRRGPYVLHRWISK